jgi:hypothetical protein
VLYQALIVAAVAFLVGWLFLDSVVSGVMLAAALGAAMYFATKRKP